MYAVRLPRLRTFEAWRATARRCAAHQVPPEEVSWALEGETQSLFEQPEPRFEGPQTPVTVPKGFPVLAKLLCASRAPGALELAYRLLLRVSDGSGLLKNRADPDVALAESLAKNIRRDMHKMKAFVRFREVGDSDAPRRQFVSWFEPDHRIEELIAGFFARRFGDMDWVIVTPEVTTRFTDGAVHHEAIRSARIELSDATEDLWRTYYANIFNPARLKIQAMQSEMPKKYWKNLPEAALIPNLIADAEAQVRSMQAAAPTVPPARAQRFLEKRHAPKTGDLPDALRACRRCPLAAPATQTVLGEGPKDARLMVVGEQPGDQEDLAGRPFVGPAGQLFDRLASEAGLDRAGMFLTNAVKHFKFQVRGKRRIHIRPSAAEISHCRSWLEQEIYQVEPELILALGATAAQALTGHGQAITKRRGQIEKGLDGRPVFLTFHPATLLRQPDPTLRQSKQDVFLQDLRHVAALVNRPLEAAAVKRVRPDPQA